jgi:hypothetical protein
MSRKLLVLAATVAAPAAAPLAVAVDRASAYYLLAFPTAKPDLTVYAAKVAGT